MNTALLVAHVIGSILFVGPVTLATSLYPTFVTASPRAITNTAQAGHTDTLPKKTEQVRIVLHRVTRVYGVIGMLVPALGFVLAARMGILADAWVIASMILTALAAILLAFVVYPLQRRTFDGPITARDQLQLRLASGGFALLWAIVVTLMIMRPGASG